VKAVKDKEDRWVPLSPHLARLLRGHRETMEHFWQKLLKRAALRYRKFHSTRHTFITWAADGCEELGLAPAPVLAVRDLAPNGTFTGPTVALTPATSKGWITTYEGIHRRKRAIGRHNLFRSAS
jgi:hypothetical protein